MNETTNTTNTVTSSPTVKKTQRKNNTNLTVTWPDASSYFTIKDLRSTNTDFVEITLRVRLKKAIDEDKTVGVIGTTNPGKGRPSLVFAMRPVLQSVLDSAKAAGIQLDDQTKLVNVMTVASAVTPSVTVTPTVVPSTVTTAKTVTV